MEPSATEDSDAAFDATDLRGGDALAHYRHRHRNRRHPQPTYCSSFGWWRHRVDLSSNDRHCGACGNACAAGQDCVSGTCTPVCDAGLVSCTATGGAACTDVSSDPANCGGCGIACADGATCSSGTCQSACAPGLEACGDPGAPTCVDVLADARNCGGCGNVCPDAHACVSGTCTLECSAPETRCGADAGAYCTNLLADAQNCGACGAACAEGRACQAGVCTLQCASGLEVCGDACVDLAADDLNCGACGAACDPGHACENGTCAVQCASGQLRCEDANGLFCADPSSDGANCGACGNACPGGTICVSGACQTVCDGTTVACGGVCVEAASDPANCGSCGTTCSGETPVCEGGECVPAPLASSYEASVVFPDAIGVPVATLAFDGGSYWSYGARTKTYNQARYATDGALVATYNGTVTFSSIFSPGGNGAVYARYSGYSLVYRMSATGTFSYLVSLTGGSLVADSSLAMAPDGSEFLGLANGAVSRWSSTGAFLGNVALAGFGAENGESAAPQNARIAVASDGAILTYSNGMLSVWDRTTGARVRTVTLVGAGTTVQSHYSFSYANGMVWILDDTGQSWRGYGVGQ